MKVTCFRCLEGLILAFLMVTAVKAQEGQPPVCCGKGLVSASSSSSTKIAPEEFKQTQLVVSADASRVLGITRNQLIDRFAEALLPGKEVFLIIPVTQLLPQSDLALGQAGNSAETGIENRLLAVQETRYYKVSKTQVRSEDLDQLGHLYVSDGQTYLKITFSKGDSLGMD